MKKLLYVAPFALALALVGCSDDSSNSQSAETVEETAIAKEDTKVDAEIADFGKVTEVYFDDDVSLNKQIGTIKMEIKNIKMFKMKPSEMYYEQMDNKKATVQIIVLKFDATNASKREVGFRPEVDSKIVISNKQDEASFFDAPDSIPPGVTESFELHYEFKGDIKDEDTFVLYIEPPYDYETSEDVGKRVKWTIKLNK